MRKIYICGTDWCNPCKHIKATRMAEIQKECPDQIEYINLQSKPSAVDRFKVYKIPMIVLTEDEKTVKRYIGAYPNHNELIAWLKGEINDTDFNWQ